MRRIFALTALALSCAVTACNNGGKKPVTLKKRPAVNADASPRTKAINEASRGKNCLRVDRMMKVIASGKGERILLYTRDIGVGSYDQNDQFINPESTHLRAPVLIKNPFFVEAVEAQNIPRSELGPLLNVVAIDDSCRRAALQFGDKSVNFDILRPSSERLVLRNQNSASEQIIYHYSPRGNELTITHLAPNGETYCGERPQILRRQYVLAREKAASSVRLNREMAQGLSELLDAPADLKASLEKAGRALELRVTPEQANQWQKALASGRIKAPECKKTPAP